jgi:hypothetical protein
MSLVQQCPRCQNSLVGVAAIHGMIFCPVCQQPVSDLEAFPVVPATSNRRATQPKSTNKLLIPMGYAAFVVVPAAIAIYLLISNANRPTDVQVEKGTPTPEPPIQVARINSEQGPKKNQAISGNEKELNNTSGASPATLDLSKQTSPPSKAKNNKTSNSKDDTVADAVIPALEVAPAPRIKLVYGTLRLVTSVAVKDGVEAWVEIDGKKEKTWKVGSFQVELKLATGVYMVKVIALFKGVRRTVYEGEVEITVNKLKEVSVEPGK